MNLLGQRLKEIRETAGIGQAEMSRLLQLQGWDCDYATLNRLENGKRTLTDIEISILLHVLGKDWDVFFGIRIDQLRPILRRTRGKNVRPSSGP